METIGSRIKALRQAKKWSQQKLGDEVEVSKTSVIYWEKDENIPKHDSLLALAKKLNTTTEYLTTGKADPIRAHLEEGRGVAVTTDQLSEEDKEQRIWLSVYDIRFCCGDGGSIEFHYDVIKKKELPFEPAFFIKRKVKPENVRLAYANNDSNEPYIYDGDLFGMDISDTTIRDGEMYAIYFGGQAMLKQIFIEGKNTLRLHSINDKKYPDRFVSEENGTDFQVIGRQFYRSG
ncbi:MAG: LexA family transcriptional regulator [Patescibacteria group bacterium]|nr:LexA family transcriptional regulator [Patescibacteria group bacterium]